MVHYSKEVPIIFRKIPIKEMRKGKEKIKYIYKFFFNVIKVSAKRRKNFKRKRI